MNIILLGYPGAGKGTQAEFLVKEYQFEHISTGDMIRKEIALQTPFGKEVEKGISQGFLVRDEQIIRLVEQVLKQGKSSYIFDGFPRTIPQAQSLGISLNALRKKIDYVILLELSKEEVVKRLTSRRVCSKCRAIYNIHDKNFTGKCSCGGQLITRSDDTVESAKQRLEVFEKQTRPLVDFYESSLGIVRVDASKPAREVHNEILRAIGLKK
jgi:adenylate kinase